MVFDYYFFCVSTWRAPSSGDTQALMNENERLNQQVKELANRNAELKDKNVQLEEDNIEYMREIESLKRQLKDEKFIQLNL